MPDPAPTALLLDTHVWIWVVEGSRDELSKATAREISAGSRRGDILVSVISVWEIAMLEARGRISLSRSIEEWVRVALRAPGVRLLDLSPEIAIESTRLPDEPHGDPADRILVASARMTGARLVTRDEAILEYGESGHLTVLDARALNR